MNLERPVLLFSCIRKVNLGELKNLRPLKTGRQEPQELVEEGLVGGATQTSVRASAGDAGPSSADESER